MSTSTAPHSGRSRWARQMVPLAAVQVVGLVCGVVGVRWSSSIVPPDVLGAYGLLVSTHTFGAFVTHQGFIQHAQRHWTADTSARTYLRALRGRWLAPTALLLVGLLGVTAVSHATIGVSVGWAWWAWMAAVNLLAWGAHEVHAMLQAEQRYGAHFAVYSIGSITRSLLPLALVFVGHATLGTLGTGFLLHASLWLGAGLIALRPAWARPESTPVEPPRHILQAFVGVGLCSWLASNAARWFAAVVLDRETTGYFILASNLSSLIPTAVALIGVGYTFPKLFAAARDAAPATELLRQTNRHVALAVTIGQLGLLALVACAPWLIGWFVDARYAHSIGWILGTGGAALATVSAGFYCNLLVAQKREMACLRLMVMSVGLRLLILAGLVIARDPAWFRFGLVLLPWPSLAFEAWYVRRCLQPQSA